MSLKPNDNHLLRIGQNGKKIFFISLLKEVKIKLAYELTGFFLVAFAITPPKSPHSAAKPVTKTMVTSQTCVVGAFLILPVFACKSIEIFHPIVESKRPVKTATKTPFFRLMMRVP